MDGFVYLLGTSIVSINVGKVYTTELGWIVFGVSVMLGSIVNS